MLESHRCCICEAPASERTIPGLLPGQRFEDWHLCEVCLELVKRGFRLTTPDGARDPSLDRPGVRLTEPQLRGLIDVGLQADGDMPGTREARHDLERQHLVRGGLREIDADLEDAMAASGRGDWAGTLDALRMIQGRAVIARRILESMLGSRPAVADLPPLVRAVQAVGRVISDREVESLAPDELRARMHAILEALDHELQAFLEPPGGEPVPAGRDRDARPGGPSAPARR
jgi:hypothetical protein